MRIVYRVPITTSVVIADHWDIPLQGGVCRVIEENGRAVALEITFNGQPLNFAPSVEEVTDGSAKLLITGRDPLLSFVKRQLESAITFLHCFFDVRLATENIEARYEAEPHEDGRLIPVKSMRMDRKEHVLPLPFDMLARAIMAAENQDGPKFEAALATAARNALSEQQYINSFRYSFLLIESLYGEGQFKSAGLKSVLKSNGEFIGLMKAAVTSRIKPRLDHVSDTEDFLKARPDLDDVIDHLVEKRGFYFHGNIKRKDAWKPESQEAAQSLAFLAVSIVQQIIQKSASPIFEPNVMGRFSENAEESGAIIMFKIQFRYREPEDRFSRSDVVEVSAIGKKVTSHLATGIAKHFLDNFVKDLPVGSLENAVCTVGESGEKVFEINFHIKD